ncbi:response regulator, partial [bacterium]|nr:response regulator [bacterium]
AQLDHQIQQAQKAESLGRMAGAIAHHFNNQLSVVIGNLEMIKSGLPKGHEIWDSISNAMKGASRAAEVSRLMLTYLGKTPSQNKLLDLSRLCIETIPMLQAVMPVKIRLVTDLPEPGPAILADEGQIRQVLMNLATNAWESIGDLSGEINLSVSLVRAEDIPASSTFRLDWQPRAGAYACLSVSDSGCGMTQEVHSALFDPFFSTKFTGRGLGLPVTAGIVRAHQGGICAESETGKGSVFRVYLPVMDVKPEIPENHEAPVPKKGKVLLAEDDAMVRKMTSAMLFRLGYDVVEATDGADAVEKFRMHGRDIDCVLLDITMPSLDGWEAMHAIRILRVDMPVILISGYDESLVMRADPADKPQAFIQKPFRINDLKTAMDKAGAAFSPAAG